MFSRAPAPPPEDPRGLAVDALGSVLRSMAAHALPQEEVDAETFRRAAEAWAQHVLVASPPPGAAAEAASARDGRRDWEGLRRFVEAYCRSSAARAAGLAGDLREVVGAFLRNFTEALAAEELSDALLRERVEHLERVAAESDASLLKREVLGTLTVLGEELARRRDRQRAQLASLGETVRALGDQLASARREGETDPLTRVQNRKAFDAYLAETVEVCGALRQPASLLLVDVDRFKAINDAHGHLAGDEVLKAVANAIARVFARKSDFVARYGGDELAVVLRETPAADALRLASRLLERVRGLRVRAGDAELAVTVSVGVAPLERGDDATALFERCDRGLYAAKAAGRDGCALGGAPPAEAPAPAPGEAGAPDAARPGPPA